MTKKVLVTGGAGFIGSEVVKQLLEKKYDVHVVDDLSKPESKVKGDYQFTKLDLTDYNATKDVFKDADVCINLAAKIGGIGYFHKIPATILSENNKIYSSTFEAAKDANIERMVYLSSSMVFESTTKFPSQEDDVTIMPPPVSSYGFSKLSGEWYCQAFQEEYNLDYTIIRPFNAYGINEYPGEEIGYAHVIPDLVKKVLDGQYPLEMLGDGEQTRCFTHVSDIADGIITAMESEKGINQAFNISNDEELKMIELAEIIWDKLKPDQAFKASFVKGYKHDIKRRVPDVNKAREVLNWEAKVKLKEGLDDVITWLKESYKKE